MLEAATLVAFVPTSDTARARRFYQDVLGFRLLDNSPFAVVFDACGTMLRVAAAAGFKPHPFTVLGFSVANLEECMTEMAAKGIVFERYRGMDQDGAGVWTAPSTSRIAWFKDPDGNLLSVSTQGATSPRV